MTQWRKRKARNDILESLNKIKDYIVSNDQLIARTKGVGLTVHAVKRYIERCKGQKNIFHEIADLVKETRARNEVRNYHGFSAYTLGQYELVMDGDTLITVIDKGSVDDRLTINQNQ